VVVVGGLIAIDDEMVVNAELGVEFDVLERHYKPAAVAEVVVGVVVGVVAVAEVEKVEAGKRADIVVGQYCMAVIRG
jgi:hypothetical protein